MARESYDPVKGMYVHLFDESEPFVARHYLGDAENQISGLEYGTTGDDWSHEFTPQHGGITTPPRYHESDSQEPRSYISHGQDTNYLPGFPSRPGVEAAPDYENVGQQFLDRINPLLDRIRKRPLGPNYHLLHDVPAQGTWRGNEFSVSLKHTDPETNKVTTVGNVKWQGNTGHVDWLGIDKGHRHMTMQLLQEAWDTARVHNELHGTEFHGPATSDEINEHSGPIVAKYNPESREYGRSDYARGIGEGHSESDDAYNERMFDEASRSQRDSDGEECPACGGAGESVLVAEHGNATSWAGGLGPIPGDVGRSRSIAFRERGTQSRWGVSSDHDEFEFEFNHPNYGALFSRDWAMTHGYTRVHPWNVPSWNSSNERWVKPCEQCAHLGDPGFPNSDNAATARYRMRPTV